jgi:hypothetical protein
MTVTARDNVRFSACHNVLQGTLVQFQQNDLSAHRVYMNPTGQSRSERARPRTCAYDGMLGKKITPVSTNSQGTIAGDEQVQDRGVFSNVNAAQGTRAPKRCKEPRITNLRRLPAKQCPKEITGYGWFEFTKCGGRNVLDPRSITAPKAPRPAPLVGKSDAPGLFGKNQLQFAALLIFGIDAGFLPKLSTERRKEFETPFLKLKQGIGSLRVTGR